MESNICIRTKNLNLFYDAFHALKDVNLEVPQKEITAFIGPSGCGKTTLLKCFNRMNDLIKDCRKTGIIEINGTNINSDIDVNALRRDVGMVFQKPNVFPMSVQDNITYGPMTHGIKKKSILDNIVFDSLQRAGLWNEVKDRLNKSALSLSGGQQQRLCIARALAVSPLILLMDEPTSALDPISTGKIEDLCEELKMEYTIVIVTHNMSQAVRISDNTAFFLLGEMLEFGKSDDVFANPKNKKCENYITGRFG
ncbi:MAG: phosphate ABC transporter ATP-binding protein PstB [Christensenellaceae bacterium]|jgi:phosphate transport system ATP-binding protein|nr:phosphate ABC transporter ATP-binding protein PstB [Christensenellaceae bacterium]